MAGRGFGEEHSARKGGGSDSQEAGVAASGPGGGRAWQPEPGALCMEEVQK